MWFRERPRVVGRVPAWTCAHPPIPRVRPLIPCQQIERLAAGSARLAAIGASFNSRRHTGQLGAHSPTWTHPGTRVLQGCDCA